MAAASCQPPHFTHISIGSNHYLEKQGENSKERNSNFSKLTQSTLTIWSISLLGESDCPVESRIKEGVRHTTEKAMAPHSSTLAWKIPWEEEPGRLQSMG